MLRQTIKNDYSPVTAPVETEFGEMRVTIHVKKTAEAALVDQTNQHPQFLDGNGDMTDTDTGTQALRQSRDVNPANNDEVELLYWTDDTETTQTFDVTAFPVMEQIIRYETVQVQELWEGTNNPKYNFTNKFTIEHEVLDQTGEHMHWIRVGAAELNEAETNDLVSALNSYTTRKSTEKGW